MSTELTLARCTERDHACSYGQGDDGRRAPTKSYIQSLEQRVQLLERLLREHVPGLVSSGSQDSGIEAAINSMDRLTVSSTSVSAKTSLTNKLTSYDNMDPAQLFTISRLSWMIRLGYRTFLAPVTTLGALMSAIMISLSPPNPTTRHGAGTSQIFKIGTKLYTFSLSTNSFAA